MTIIDSEKLASKLALKMAEEYGRILVRHHKEQREIRRLLRIHAANESITSEQSEQFNTPMLSRDKGNSAT